MIALEGWQGVDIEANAPPEDTARYIPEVFRLCHGFQDMGDHPKPIDKGSMRYARLPDSLGAPDTFLIGPEEALARVRVNPVRMADGSIEIGVVGDARGILTECFKFKTDPSGKISEPVLAYGGTRHAMQEARDTWPVKELNSFGSPVERYISVVSVECVITRSSRSRMDRAINFLPSREEIFPHPLRLRTREEALARIERLDYELMKATLAYQDGDKDKIGDIQSIPYERGSLQNFVDGVYPDAEAIRTELIALPGIVADVKADLKDEQDFLRRRSFPTGMSDADTQKRNNLLDYLRALAARRAMLLWLLHGE
jgi:hypothetical protein